MKENRYFSTQLDKTKGSVDVMLFNKKYRRVVKLLSFFLIVVIVMIVSGCGSNKEEAYYSCGCKIGADCSGVLVVMNMDAATYESYYKNDVRWDCQRNGKDINTSVSNATPNASPRADAGPDQSVIIGSKVTLNGSGSSDLENHSLNYHWDMVSTPPGSKAVLSDSGSAMPDFIPDATGAYVFSLSVDDGNSNSKEADAVRIVVLSEGKSNIFTSAKVVDWSLPPFGNPRTGDFNNDGKVDIALNCRVLLGNGLGGFYSNGLPTDPSDPYSCGVMGDFNNDGNMDITMTDTVKKGGILWGDGTGAFIPEVGITGGISNMVVGDFNDDGNLDLAGFGDQQNILINIGDGTGKFLPPFDLKLNTYFANLNVNVIDLNHDNIGDLIFIFPYETGTIGIIYGNHENNFSVITEKISEEKFYKLVTGDFNSDGLKDIIVATARTYSVDIDETLDAEISVMLGNGKGGFSAPYSFGLPNIANSIQVMDFNDDSNLDLFIGHEVAKDYKTNYSISVLFGDGKGGFPILNMLDIGDVPGGGKSGMVFDDFNGDSKIDIAAANPSKHSLSILLACGNNVSGDEKILCADPDSLSEAFCTNIENSMDTCSSLQGVRDIGVDAGGITYVFSSDGSVKCWEDETDSVCNQDFSDVLMISSAVGYTCALFSDGQVKCWGDNKYGQLGDGTSTPSSTPVPVSDISDAIAVATGWSHACAVLSDGRVKCWGMNVYGQLGNGTTTAFSSTPISVSGIDNAVFVSSGAYHTCVLLSDGQAKCWGMGQLGNGTTTLSSTPVPVSGIYGAIDITAGESHTCVLLSDGTVKCWGINGYGQLGDGTTTLSSTPVSVSGISDAITVMSGTNHTCALLSDSQVKCWGANYAGQLGDGTTTSTSTPVLVSDVSTATSIRAGRGHTCAILSDGTAKCWGGIFLGQLRYESNYTSPVLIRDVYTPPVNTEQVKPSNRSILGMVTVNGVGLGGITMILKGDVYATTTTAPDGSYTFPGLPDGSYNINPRLDGYLFIPSSHSVTIVGGDIIGKDFVAISIQTSVELPETGQTTCYDSAGNVIVCTGTGQDGEIQAGVRWPNPRFTDNSDGTIEDNLTGLMWVKDGNLMAGRDPGFDADSTLGDGKVTWQHALDYVAKLNAEAYLGYTDWRLPNIIELESISNTGQSDETEWLNTQGFTNVQGYWSSTSYAGQLSKVWTYGGGSVYASYKSNDSGYYYDYYVWPVRSGQSMLPGSSIIQLPKTGQTNCYDSAGNVIPCAGTGQDGDIQAGVSWTSPRFTDKGDGSVTDNLTGLMWTKNANLLATKDPSFDADGKVGDGQVSWQHALDYVSKLNADMYLGYTDWRLPNRKELYSLIDFSRYWAALPSGYPFLNVQSLFYWSSTSIASDALYVWLINIQNGSIGPIGKDFSGVYVWPVRSGP